MLPVDTVNAPYDAIFRIARAYGGHDEAHFQQLEARFITRELRSAARRHDAESRLETGAGIPASQHLALGNTLATTLNAYVLGTAKGLLFAELRPESITVMAAQLDDLGVPSRDTQRASLSLRWRELLPPAEPGLDEDAYLFQMAGGRGELAQPPVALIDGLTSRLQPLLPVGALSTDLRIVLINRLPGWPAAKLLHAAVETRCPWINEETIATDDHRSFEVIVDDILAGAPLRFDYDLVVASIDSMAGQVKADTLPLFPSGATRSAPAKSVSILAHNTCRGDLQVMIVARKPATELRHRPVVFSGTLPLSAGESCALTLQLERPGALRFAGLRTPAPTSLTLPGILSGLPEFIVNAGQASSLDLVILLDLIGRDEQVAERKAYIKDTLSILTDTYKDQGSLRVALIGVRDEVHVEYERKIVEQMAPQKAVEWVDFQTPARIMTAIDAARPFNHQAQDYPSALDEALEDLGTLSWRLALSRKCVVIVTSRPPHPEQQDSHQLTPSRTKEEWGKVFREVRDARALRAILVECPSSWRVDGRQGPIIQELPRVVTEYTEACWQTLGADGRFLMEETPPERLSAEIDEGNASNAHSIRLPLRAFGG